MKESTEQKHGSKYVPPLVVSLGEVSKLTFGGGSKPPNDNFNPKVITTIVPPSQPPPQN